MAPAKMHGILRLEQGEEILAELELTPGRPVILGRSEQAEVRVQHATVSRRHARLWIDAEGAQLEDLGSSNGTLLDGQKIEGQVTLADGQRIQLGQRTVAEPVKIRFEDPAAGVLREMGLWDDSPAARTRAGSSADEEAPAESGREGAAATAPAGTNLPATDSSAAASPSAGERRVGEELRDPRVLLILAFALVLVAGASIGLLRFLRPAATYWRSVQIMPAEIGPDVAVRLSSFDIGRASGLELLLGDTPVEDLQVERGRLSFRAPQLDTLGGGKLGLPLVARRGGVEVYQRVLTYNVVPRLDPLPIEQLPVGEVLTLSGRGLHEDASKIAVYFGEQAGWVLESDSRTVRVRVPPVLAQDSPPRLALRVEVDGLRAAAPLPDFAILPWIGEPLRLELSASFRDPVDDTAGAWQLHHALGPAYVLDGPAPAADGSLPAAVAQVIERWNQLFEVVERDPRVRLVGRTAAESCELVAVGGAVGGAGLSVARFARGELALALGLRPDDLSNRNLCARTASVWDHLLNAFARGQEVRGLASPPPYVRVLDRLVAASRWRGGNGRPAASDLVVLDATDRERLAQAFANPGG